MLRRSLGHGILDVVGLERTFTGTGAHRAVWPASSTAESAINLLRVQVFRRPLRKARFRIPAQAVQNISGRVCE